MFLFCCTLKSYICTYSIYMHTYYTIVWCARALGGLSSLLGCVSPDPCPAPMPSPFPAAPSCWQIPKVCPSYHAPAGYSFLAVLGTSLAGFISISLHRLWRLQNSGSASQLDCWQFPGSSPPLAAPQPPGHPAPSSGRAAQPAGRGECSTSHGAYGP